MRLRVPKLRRQTFETAIIERYRRRESSVEEALIEMYLAGVSVPRRPRRRRSWKNSRQLAVSSLLPGAKCSITL